MAPETDLSRLKAALLTSGIQTKEPALFQVIDQLINVVKKAQDALTANVVNNTVDLSDLVDSLDAVKALSFLTTNSEALLTGSRRVLAGTGITFDDSIAGQRTINGSVAEGYWTLLTDGDLTETEFIFAAGDPIAMFVPL